MFKRLYCLGVVLGCLMYCVGVIGVIYAPTVWIVHRMFTR
jgi:hypothetical protein